MGDAAQQGDAIQQAAHRRFMEMQQDLSQSLAAAAQSFQKQVHMAGAVPPQFDAGAFVRKWLIAQIAETQANLLLLDAKLAKLVQELDPRVAGNGRHAGS